VTPPPLPGRLALGPRRLRLAPPGGPAGPRSPISAAYVWARAGRASAASRASSSTRDGLGLHLLSDRALLVTGRFRRDAAAPSRRGGRPARARARSRGRTLTRAGGDSEGLAIAPGRHHLHQLRRRGPRPRRRAGRLPRRSCPAIPDFDRMRCKRRPRGPGARPDGPLFTSRAALRRAEDLSRLPLRGGAWAEPSACPSATASRCRARCGPGRRLYLLERDFRPGLPDAPPAGRPRRHG
jgi:hypothetical protein